MLDFDAVARCRCEPVNRRQTRRAAVESTMTELALNVENLVKIYPNRGSGRGARPPVRAVDGVSFSVPSGKIFGLLGPNGAGKTTILKTLSTRIQPTSGRAEVLGYDVVARPLEVRRRISTVVQEAAVDMLLTTRDNLLTYARFHGIKGPEARRRADHVLERFQLGPEADRKVMDLSGGYRRRVQVAKIFLVDTPVIFLDEFSTGMDPILKRAVMDDLRQAAARGRTIILTTQILSEAEELCEDILIVNNGRQVARGDLNTLKLLSEGVYEVSITFEKMPAHLEESLTALQPLRQVLRQNTLELALKVDESRLLEIVTELAKQGRVLRVEIGGASLEDIFIELMQK
jgi:ABC-2 type transport system ATP-binding protein